MFNFEYNTISPSEGYISDDGSTFYSIVENNAVALDTDSVISSLKHSYPWGSPFQIHIDGEQYWENTYRLIDEHLAVVGGGGGGNLLRILRIAPSNHSFFEEAA